jgi:hypothetical protein
MTRVERIERQLTELERRGVIRPDWYTGGGEPRGNRRRWMFTPVGFTERALSTAEVELFILGTEAVANGLRDEIKDALEGDSNDAEHDALVSCADSLSIAWEATPDAF